MNAGNWITLATLALSGLALLATFFAPDRSKSRLESIEKAMELRERSGLEEASKDDLDRFVKFTARQLGEVWWRHPFSVLAVISLLLAAVQGFVSFTPIGGEDTPTSWWVQCVFFLAVGIVLFVATAVIQKKAGLLENFTGAKSDPE